MKKTQSRRAKAQSNVHLNTETSTMESIPRFISVAMGLTMVATINTGCQGPSESLDEASLTVNAHAPDCRDSVTDKPDFCESGLGVSVTRLEEGSSTNPSMDSPEDVPMLTFDGEGNATIVVEHLPGPGTYLIEWAGLTPGYFATGVDADGQFTLHRISNQLNTVIDNGPDGNGGGSRTGDACVTMRYEGNEVDPTYCQVLHNGSVVTGDPVPDGMTCSGIYLANIAAETATFEAACTVDDEGLEGALTLGIAPGMTTPVPIPLAPAGGSGGTDGGTDPDPTGVCFWARDDMDAEQNNCTFKENGQDIVDDPVPDGVTCDHHFRLVEPGLHTFSAECGSMSGSATFTVADGEIKAKSILVTEPVPQGDLCFAWASMDIDEEDFDNGFNAYVGVAQGLIGFGDDQGGCDTQSFASEYAEMEITNVEAVDVNNVFDDCNGGCLLAPMASFGTSPDQGLYPHLVLGVADLSDIPQDEKYIYLVTVVYKSGQNDEQTLEFGVRVKNGVIING